YGRMAGDPLPADKGRDTAALWDGGTLLLYIRYAPERISLPSDVIAGRWQQRQPEERIQDSPGTAMRHSIEILPSSITCFHRAAALSTTVCMSSGVLPTIFMPSFAYFS